MSSLRYEPVSEPRGPVGAEERRSRRRRRIAFGAGGIALAALLIVVTAFAWRSVDEEDATWSAQILWAKEPTAFSTALREPPVRRSSLGELATTLSVQAARFQVGPFDFHTRAYEGTLPGPTLVLQPGDRLLLQLVNTLQNDVSSTLSDQPLTYHYPNKTNLHTHGLHVSPAGIADNIYRVAEPGETLQYDYGLPKDHYPGVFYYHPHLEGSSALHTFGGMAGAIIVEDDPAAVPTELLAAEDVLMVLQEAWLDRYASVNAQASNPVVGLGQTELESELEIAQPPLHFFLANGQFQPIITTTEGQLTRLRLVHAGASYSLSLRLAGGPATASTAASNFEADDDDSTDSSSSDEPRNAHSGISENGPCDFLTLARDGVYLDAPRRQNAVVMAPGSRADVLVRCMRPGMYRLESSFSEEASAFIGDRSSFFGGTVGFLEIRPSDLPAGDGIGVEAAPLPTWLPRRPQRLFPNLTALNDSEIGGHFVFEMNQGGKVERSGRNYTWYGVNGRAFNASYISHTVPLNGTEEWVVVNQRLVDEQGRDTSEEARSTHPFHAHVNHFQIVSYESGAAPNAEPPDWQIGDWRDTILLPSPGNVTIRWRADDFAGKTVAHCHIFTHADTGMSINFEIVDGH